MKRLTKEQEKSLVYVGTQKGNTVYYSKGQLAAYARHREQVLYVADLDAKSELHEKHLDSLIKDLEGYEVLWSSEQIIKQLIKV